MIVRIMLEGQYDVPDTQLDTLNELDRELEHAVNTGDETEFRTALHQLLGRVREAGTAAGRRLVATVRDRAAGGGRQH